MKILKIATILALASIPLIVMASKKKTGVRPVAGDSDSIFDQELSVD